MTTTFRRARSGLYIPRGAAATYDSRVLSDLAPAVAYRFDDGPAGAAATGAQMTDYSGNANHGVYVNGPTLSSSSSTGVTFNPTGSGSQYATMPISALPIGNSAYTIETVVNIAVLAQRELLTYGSSGTKTANGFELESSGEFSNWWGGINLTSSGAALTTSTWYVLTATYDGSGTVTVYRNGTQVGTKAMTGHVTGTTSAWVGRSITTGGNYFPGTYRRLSIAATCDTASNIAARAALAPLT